MTAGNNGDGMPENDDPFAYLYRSEGGEGEAGGTAPRTGGYGYPGPAQPGVPRTSYHQVSRVGERRYGQQAQQTQQQTQRIQQPQQAPETQQQPYAGQQDAYTAQQPPYAGQATQATQVQSPYAAEATQVQPPAYAPDGQSGSAHYAAPETLPGGAPRRSEPASHGGRGSHGGGRGPNSKGLLIGAIAVVAVVIIGIGIAMATNGGGSDDKKNEAGHSAPPAAAQGSAPADKPSGPPEVQLPKQDAASLRIDSPATTDSSVKGAKSTTGSYVGMNAPGAAATWTTDVDKGGQYRLYVRYGVPGKDANLTLTTNGKPATKPLNMKNFAGTPEGDWEHGWQNTWSMVTLTKGTNTIKMSCETGNACEVNLDRVALRPANGPAPDGW